MQFQNIKITATPTRQIQILQNALPSGAAHNISAIILLPSAAEHNIKMARHKYNCERVTQRHIHQASGDSHGTGWIYLYYNPNLCFPLGTTIEDVCKCDIIFISVPTPAKKDGSIDLSILESVLKECSAEVETENPI